MPHITPDEHPDAKLIEGSVTAPDGFMAAGISCGIKRSGKPDIALLLSSKPAACAGMLTSNRVRAACVDIVRERISDGFAQALICNSGNANCFTGEQGFKDALELCAVTGQTLGLKDSLVLGASTGVIGQLLPMDRIRDGIGRAAEALSDTAGPVFARAIMTTDTVPKSIACEMQLSGGSIRIGLAAKGSGMIEPNLATMFCFITTDAEIDKDVIDGILHTAVNQSFNCLTIDSDTSTNDMVLILANGVSGVTIESDADREKFQDVLNWLCREMAKAIAADGEGATKLVEVVVKGALSDRDARLAAKAIANSPLVKTAIFGRDPNWGRITAAAGRSGAEVEQEKLTLYIQDEIIVDTGKPVKTDRELSKELFSSDKIVLDLDLGLGDCQVTVWTCDFSYDYVKINAEYHT